MVKLTTGVNRIRDLVGADFIDGLAGTATAALSESQTGLISAVPNTESDVTVEYSNKTLTVTHIIGPLQGNGSNLTEWTIRMFNETVSFHRILTAPISKTSSEQIQKVTSIFFK